MDYKKTLRWVEPFGGWKNSDTGFCNRLFHWEIAHEIMKNNNYEHQILLQKKFWPELGLIYLPNTSFMGSIENDTPEIDSNRLRTVYGKKGDGARFATPIRIERVTEMFKSKEFTLTEDNHWYSDFGYEDIFGLYGKEPEGHRSLSLIKLKHNFIDDFLRKNTQDVIGIHIRRGVGIRYTESDIQTLPEKIQDLYKSYQVLNRDSQIFHIPKYMFIRDEFYFNSIDRILEFNPRQKFYISTDLPYYLISYYKDRYGDNVFFKENLVGPVKDYLMNSDISLDKLKYGNVVENVVDLFALSFCKLLIKSPKSTWSDFAQVYRNQPSVNATDDWYDIIIHKYLDIKWLQPGSYDFDENLGYKHLNDKFDLEK